MTGVTLVDIGINLAHDSYDADRPQVIARARAAGVTHMIVTGSSIAGTRRAIELVREYPQALRATAGVHPHHAQEFTADQREELRGLLQAEEVCSAGECGLDYFRNFSPQADQQRAFRAQLELAVEAKRPLFLHQRDAHSDFVAILRDYLPRVPAAVAHCFTGTRAQLDEYLSLGLYIGVTGWINDERRGQLLKELVVSIPAERLMLETDGPYLLPRDLAAKPATRRNEPKYLVHILETVARLRRVAPQALGAQTTANAQRFFGWPAVK
jgi:TatD DNase family protein